MKLTASGIPVGGVGAAGVFVGRECIKGGGTATTDDTRVFYQSPTDTVRSCFLDGSDDRLELDSGASLIVAGGGHWAVWLAGSGVVTSWDLRLPLAAVLAMTDAGDLLVVLDHDAGKGMALYRAGAVMPLWAMLDAEPIILYPYPQAYTLDADRLIWRDSAGKLWSRGLPAPQQTTSVVFDPFLLEHPSGDVWVGYHDGLDRLVVHPIDDASQGYVLATGMTYGTTATGGFVGFSRTPSESEMESILVDWSAPLVSLAPPMPEVSVAPFARSCWLAPFHATRLGEAVECPGHAEIVTDGDDAAMRKVRRPVIADLKSIDTVDDPLALFTAIGVGDPINERGIADALRIPLIAYYDAPQVFPADVLTALRPTDWIGIQLYCDPSESYDVFRSRCFQQVAAVAGSGLPICLVVQMYDRNGTEKDLAKMSEIQPIWRELAESFPAVIAIAPFAVLRDLRDDDGAIVSRHGVMGYPFLQEWLGAYADAMTAPDRPVVALPPSLPPPEPPPMPSPHLALIERVYLELLHRRPDPVGIEIYTARLNSGWTEDQFRADVMASPEYAALHPPPVPIASGTAGYAQASDEASARLDKDPPPAGPVPTLSIRGRQFFDGDRLYIPRWVSGLTLLVRTSAQQDAFLDWALRTGFNGVRVFAGALTWAGQTADGARAALPALLNKAASRGLTVEVTAITDSATGYDVGLHLRGVVDILAGRRGIVLELANEIGHPTQSSDITADRLRQWGQEIAEPRGLLWALGAASTDEPIDGVYAASGGRYCTAHLDRGRPSWNNVRRVREIYAIVESHGVPAINNEPMGADELDGSQTGKQRWNDPALFFTLGALDRAFGVGGVHHSQAGLMAQVPGPVQQQCADAYVAGHAGVETVLPGVVGQYKNVGHAGGPFSSARFVEGGSEGGVVRAYSFIAGRRGVTVLVGAKGDISLVWMNGWRQVREVARRTAKDGLGVVVMEITR